MQILEGASSRGNIKRWEACAQKNTYHRRRMQAKFRAGATRAVAVRVRTRVRLCIRAWSLTRLVQCLPVPPSLKSWGPRMRARAVYGTRTCAQVIVC